MQEKASLLTKDGARPKSEKMHKHHNRITHVSRWFIGVTEWGQKEGGRVAIWNDRFYKEAHSKSSEEKLLLEL